MRSFKKVVAAAALLCAPAAALGQNPSGVASPGAGYSQGVAAGWQNTGRGARTVRASGAAAAAVIVAAAAAATFRRR